MAQNNPFAGVETQIAQINAQFREIVELLEISPDSRPIVAQSTFNSFGDALEKATEELNSYRQRWSTIDEREVLLVQEKSSLAEKNKQLEEKAAALKKWEERLTERESNIIKTEQLLAEKKNAIDRREMTVDKLTEDARTGLQKAFEEKLSLDERKETVIAAEGRHAADEQALERWQEFLNQKHSDIIALHKEMNEVRAAARTEHNQAVEKLNQDFHQAHDIFKGAEKFREDVINMYQRAKGMVEDLHKTQASVVRDYEKLLKHIQDEKLNINRMQVHGTLLKSGNSKDNREFDLLLEKVERLNNGLERVGIDMNEQEARLNAFLKKVSQAIDPSHDMGSSPEKPPAKRQRSSRAVSVGPTEVLFGSQVPPESLPEDVLDPFSSSVQPQPDPQPSSPGTLIPSSQAIGPISGVDPTGIVDASDFIKGVWAQIQFPRDWQAQDSKSLLEKFNKNEKKEVHWRPDGCMNRGAKWTNEGERSICLLREFTRKKAAFTDGIEKRCEECKKRGGPCVNVSWANEAEGGEEGKKWLLVKRK